MMRGLNILVRAGMLIAELNDDGEWVYRHSPLLSIPPSEIVLAEFMLEDRYDEDDE
jgi:hypothetical protein